MITIIAVNYRTAALFGRMLSSLAAQTYSKWRLIVVDNSQDADEFASLLQQVEGYPNVSVIRAPENLGYLNGADFALKTISRNSSDWTIVANIDIRFEPTALQELGKLDPSVAGILAPSIRSSSTGLDQNPYMLKRPSRVKSTQRRILFANPTIARTVVLAAGLRAQSRALLHRSSYAADTRPRDAAVSIGIYAAHGSCFALSRYYFEYGGDLSHPVFLFAEELTLAERSMDLGLPVVYQPTVRVHHEEHASTGVWRRPEVIRWQCEAVSYSWRLLRTRRPGPR